ncbi:MAG: hypothetical protein ACI9IP_003191 [Arcticibacterium sp.]|jgi:hypothetical protein
MTPKLFNSILLFLTFQAASAQFMSKADSQFEINRKKPVSFSYQPFILLKVTPTAVFGRDNVLQYGVELAPPFGKFSFGFDYGKGKSSWSFDKGQKLYHPDQETKIIRGEIRGYFSDWYPFYALDKKPFGRYYALEYVQKDLTYGDRPIIDLYADTKVPGTGPYNVTYLERALHVKFGNHFIVARWFFIDAFAGIGVGIYNSKQSDLEIAQVKNPFTFGKPPRDFTSKGLFLSKTAGVRFAVPI